MLFLRSIKRCKIDEPLILSNSIISIRKQSSNLFHLNQKVLEKHQHQQQKQQPKLLLDTFGRKHDYLRISLTERCNLRCLYCMPQEGVSLTPQSKLLNNEEIYRLASLFVNSFGVKKIRLTGGEPLIRKDIVEIISNLSKLKNDGLEKISITTNGIVFSRFSKLLHQAGLDSVNISLDTLKKDRFQLITRRNGLDKVLKSIETALNEQYECVKINFVPINGLNDDEIEDFVELTRNLNVEVRFIEYMPFDGNQWNIEKMIGFRELINRIKTRFELKPMAPLSLNDTAMLFKVNGYQGKIGFINSMTNAFCSGCNRVRLTADGHLKVCLFGKEEISLKEAIRNGQNDQEMIETIIQAVKMKKKQHAGVLELSKDNQKNRPMILIDQKRFFSHSTNRSDDQDFSHIDSNDGQVKMVDIVNKKPTVRMARACACVHLGADVIKKIESNQIAKGNVLTIAKTAAIQAAKLTSHLIPLCHQVPLDHVDIKYRFDYDNNDLIIETICRTTFKTGVEMEAMMAATIASLTIYDMCKALNKSIIIKHCHLIAKSGGKNDFSFQK